MIRDNLKAIEAAAAVARDPAIYDPAIRRYKARCAYISAAFGEALRIKARDNGCEEGLVRRTSITFNPAGSLDVVYLGRNNALVERHLTMTSLQDAVDQLNQNVLRPLGISPIYYSTIQSEVDKVLSSAVGRGGRA